MLIELRRHQLRPFEFAQERPASLLALAMGAGKSALAIAIKEAMRSQRTLIVAPSTVRSVWRRELSQHSSVENNVAILDTGSMKKRTEIAEATLRRGGNAVVVVNYETARAEPFKAWSLAQDWSLVVADESHKIQRDTSTSRYMTELGRKAEKRLALTGTAMTQEPVGVFGQCRFLDPKVFGSDHRAFMRRYWNPHGLALRKALTRLNAAYAWWGIGDRYCDPKLLTGLHHADEFYAKLAKLCIRVESSELDLPPVTFEEREIELGARASSAYRDMERTHEVELCGGLYATAGNIYAATTRLQQITSGYLPDQYGHYHTIDTAKQDALESILAEAGETVVVGCHFRRDLDVVRALCQKLRLNYGEISQRDKSGVDEMGRMPEELDVVGVQEQSGGAGIDLTRARILVNYSFSWSVADTDQLVSRVWRPPQPINRHCLVVSLVAGDTKDTDVMRTIAARKRLVQTAWTGVSQKASCGAFDKDSSVARCG